MYKSLPPLFYGHMDYDAGTLPYIKGVLRLKFYIYALIVAALVR